MVWGMIVESCHACNKPAAILRQAVRLRRKRYDMAPDWTPRPEVAGHKQYGRSAGSTAAWQDRGFRAVLGNRAGTLVKSTSTDMR
jgi:hypothetical protein